MEEFEKAIEKIFNEIKKVEEKRRTIGDKLRKDKTLFVKIKPLSVDGTIVGVDGGIDKKSLHGFDIILLKAVAVAYIYKDGKLMKVKYHPKPFAPSNPIVFSKAYSELEFELLSNIYRQSAEVKKAVESIDKFNPSLILMDGSIIPHYTHIQNKNSLIFGDYQVMIDLYKELFEKVRENGVMLAGVIKDSRGSRFCEIISNRFSPEEKLALQNTKDVTILDYVLEKNERTIVFDYTDDPEKHPVMREFIDFPVKSFYFKPSEFDIPVRVDFLGGKKEAEKISSILLSLIPSENYAVPNILIEADQRAKVSKEEIENIYQKIIARFGPLGSLKEKRRNRRIF